MKQPPKFVVAILDFYSFGYLAGLVYLLESKGYGIIKYLGQYWSTQDFTALASSRPTPNVRNRALLLFLTLGSLLQLTIGIGTLICGMRVDMPETLPFGLALLLSYPLVWAHMLVLVYFGYKVVWVLSHPKTVGKQLICAVLESQVVRLRQHHQFTVIAVAGSVGKTSTKLAIAHTLEPSRRVIYQTGNYNDRVTVPLVIFGHGLPNLLNVFVWTRIFIANERAIRRPFFYDIAVVELGTDHPGDIGRFAYLKPDIAVVTAITPEHMEYFGTLDAVADEELVVCKYSKQVLVNIDDTPSTYLKQHQVVTYGVAKNADFRATDITPKGLKSTALKLHLQHKVTVDAEATILGEQGVKIFLAAAGAAQLAGLDKAEITKGLPEIKPFAGRMQVLAGVKDSTIIDDTYNASPAPVKAALNVLYATKAPQQIAILGNMNELGDYSQEAHVEVGDYCRPDKLDLVVTIGPDAKKYLAAAAKKQGCKVESYDSPYAAGEAVLKHLQKDAVILAEGSQNGVFAEEALKVLLADKTDAQKLVRQSAYWMRVKQAQFGPESIDG